MDRHILDLSQIVLVDSLGLFISNFSSLDYTLEAFRGFLINMMLIVNHFSFK